MENGSWVGLMGNIDYMLYYVLEKIEGNEEKLWRINEFK